MKAFQLRWFLPSVVILADTVSGEQASIPSDAPEVYHVEDEQREYIEHSWDTAGTLRVNREAWPSFVCGIDRMALGNDTYCDDGRYHDWCQASSAIWDTMCEKQRFPSSYDDPPTDSQVVRGCGECIDHRSHFCSQDGDAAYIVHYNPFIPGCKQPIGECEECLKLDPSQLDSDNCVVGIQHEDGGRFCYPTEKQVKQTADAKCQHSCAWNPTRGGGYWKISMAKEVWQSIEATTNAAIV